MHVLRNYTHNLIGFGKRMPESFSQPQFIPFVGRDESGEGYGPCDGYCSAHVQRGAEERLPSVTFSS